MNTWNVVLFNVFHIVCFSPLLEFIRRELEHPYKDPRIPFESISGERAFYLLVQEDPFQFCPGYDSLYPIILFAFK